jgi:hypothetical protein
LISLPIPLETNQIAFEAVVLGLLISTLVMISALQLLLVSEFLLSAMLPMLFGLLPRPEHDVVE